MHAFFGRIRFQLSTRSKRYIHVHSISTIEGEKCLYVNVTAEEDIFTHSSKFVDIYFLMPPMSRERKNVPQIGCEEVLPSNFMIE
jgi:hypothetical protein